MATSGSTNFATTRDNLINGALRLVGAIGQGEVGTANQISEAADSLNMMIKGFMNYGMPLWAVKKYAGTLVANTSEYEIGITKTWNTPKPLKIYNAYVRNNVSNTDTPITKVSRQEYLNFSNKSASGTPVNMYYDPQNTSGFVHVYPAPTANVATNYSLVIHYQRPFEDFDAANDEPDFPQEWYEVIKYGLAVRLAGEYGLERFARKELKDEFRLLLAQAQGFNQEEESLYLQPDTNWG